MNSVKELKKKLDENVVKATKQRHQSKRALQANYWLGYAEGLEKALDLFSVFLKDYDLQAHVPRKQLSEWSQRLHDALCWNEDDMPYDVEEPEDLKELVKELLEAQK